MTLKSTFLDNYPAPYGVFRNEFTFSNIRSFLNSELEWKKGKCITKGNLSCFLLLRNNHREQSLGLYVLFKVNGSHANDFCIKSRVIFKLVNQANARRTRGCELINFQGRVVPFKRGTQLRGVPILITRRNVLDETQGFISNDSLKVILDCGAESIEGFYQPKLFNFYESFEESSEVTHDFGLLPEVHRVRYNKTLPHVHSMRIPEKFPENGSYLTIFHFELLLRVLHGEEVDEQRIGKTLECAKFCQVPAVLRKCENFIIQTNYPEIPINFILLALRFHMRRVLHAFLRITQNFDRYLLRNVKQNLDIYSGETMKSFANRIFGLYEERDVTEVDSEQ